MVNFGLGPEHVRRGLNKSGGVQILTVILFTRHVWSKTGQVQKTSLESGTGTRQVQWIGLALDMFNRSDWCAILV
jgi:hypothetical protein